MAQPQSSFLTKLPREIRRQIYDDALSTEAIHFWTRGDGTLYHRRCVFQRHRFQGSGDRKEPESHHPPCFCRRADVPGLTQIPDTRWIRCRLLLTCRQIYSEAHEIWISKHVIQIREEACDNMSYTLKKIRHRIPPDQFARVHSLEYHFSTTARPDPFPHWEETTSLILTEMQTLRNLFIGVEAEFEIDLDTDTETTITPEQDARFFQPLLSLPPPDPHRRKLELAHFEVHVTWPQAAEPLTLPALQNAPFELRRDESLGVNPIQLLRVTQIHPTPVYQRLRATE